MNIAVVDTHGDLVHFSRMDGAQLASIGISQGKARTAARYRRESRAFYNAFETGHPYVATLDPTLVASRGNVRGADRLAPLAGSLIAGHLRRVAQDGLVLATGTHRTLVTDSLNA